MTDALDELKRDVGRLLDAISPGAQSQCLRDLDRRFAAWRAVPDFALHQGALKLACEFYVRAFCEEAAHGRFYDVRNVLLDYLVAEFGWTRSFPEVPPAKWAEVAAKVATLMAQFRPKA